MKLITVLLSQFLPNHRVQGYPYANLPDDFVEYQTHDASIAINENVHTDCDMSQIDLEKYNCEEIDNIMSCTTSCTFGNKNAPQIGITKKMCQCYVSYGPVLIYDLNNCHWDDLGGECIPDPTVEETEEVDENDVDEDSNTIIENTIDSLNNDTLDNNSIVSGFLRHMSRWKKLTLVVVEDGKMQGVKKGSNKDKY